MPADLNNPFGESCCDGGKCEIKKESAQPCGCDAGANWTCMYHQTIAEIRKEQEAGQKNDQGS